MTPHVLAARCARCLTLVSDTCQRPQRCSILQFLESIWSSKIARSLWWTKHLQFVERRWIYCKYIIIKYCIVTTWRIITLRKGWMTLVPKLCLLSGMILQVVPLLKSRRVFCFVDSWTPLDAVATSQGTRSAIKYYMTCWRCNGKKHDMIHMIWNMFFVNPGFINIHKP